MAGRDGEGKPELETGSVGEPAGSACIEGERDIGSDADAIAAQYPAFAAASRTGTGTAAVWATDHAQRKVGTTLAAGAESVMDDANVWIVLECPRGAERELASQGEQGFVPFRATDAAGRLRSLKYVPLYVARHLAGEFGGRDNYNIAPDELQAARPPSPSPVRTFGQLY